MKRIGIAIIGVVAFSSLADAKDWNTYRADGSRSGYTADALPDELQLRWVYKAGQAPSPAWPTRNRLVFDQAFQPIIAGGVLYFGSSTDDKVYALDAGTGSTRWTFCTDAPVRFAPVAWENRLFVASDDGHLYCLSAETGKAVWKRRGAPRSDMLLGNDRMISRWPARGGPVLVDDRIYYGAGIWPSEGIFLYGLDARTGEVRWRNDASGKIEMDQPHANARAKSGISAQGYLATGDDVLLVPTGRAVPAVLDRRDGALRFFQLQAHQQAGGADVMVVDEYFVNGGLVYAISDGRRIGAIGLHAAAHPDWVVHARENKVFGLDRGQLTVQRETVDRKGVKQSVTRLTSPKWEVEVKFDAEPRPAVPKDLRSPEVRMNSTAFSTPSHEHEATSLIVTADQVIVGGWGKVNIIDISDRKPTWSIEVEGWVRGLAVADSRLYVSTDRGHIYCFDEFGAQPPVVVETSHELPPPVSNSIYAKTVEEIQRHCNLTTGLCVDLGCGDGSLTLELLRQTSFQIIAVDSQLDNVVRLRERLDRAGVYGSRVTVHHLEVPNVSYAEYCADLVVSGRSVSTQSADEWHIAARRLLRPYGGVLCSGPAGDMKVTVRGALAGAANWTHQNTSPANVLCSDDVRVRGTLEMLWFRDTDFLMANRHGRAPTALVQDGRMFVEGLNGLRAQSIYNGTVLWEYGLPGILEAYNREHSIGAAWTGGNMCLGPRRVFIHDGKTCSVLDTATGKRLARWEPPPHSDGSPGTWGYIAYQNGLLYGSLANEDYIIKCWSDRWDTGNQFTESNLLFALDANTGRQVWTFKPQNSIRHNAIAVGGGRVYLIDRPVAAEDDLNYSPNPRSAEARRGTEKDDSDTSTEPAPPTHPMGRLVVLDQSSGKPIWQAESEVFGTLLMYGAEDDVLWMGYQAAHQASRASERANRMAVFNAASGAKLWDIQAEYDDRPVLNGDTIYAPPGAWDLSTGSRLPFDLDRSYGCGTVAGCREMLIFRSATLGYIDLSQSSETQNYGGVRPGCWIAAIPAGGVVTMPDAASWCTCSYLNQGTLALKPVTSLGDDDN